MNSNYYNDKIKKFDEIYCKSNEELLKVKENSKNNIEKFANLKGLFSSEYNKIIEDLTAIINKVSETEEKKEVEEESPASIVRSLNLNWKDHPSCEGNLVTDNYAESGSYWYVESEQVLDGPFLCKVEIEEFSSLCFYWHHMFGIIRVNNRESTSKDNYYKDCIIMSSSGYLANKYLGEGAYKLLFRDWVKGDVLIVKRDHNNTIYFGINDEYDMKEAFTGISGEYRICMGFTCHVRTDKFKMTYLNIIK